MALYCENNTYFLTDDVSIRYERLTEAHSDHYHDFVEIIYILKGKCTHTINGIEYPVSHGNMLIVNYHQLHSISGIANDVQSAEFINILVKPKFISSNLIQPNNAFSLLNLSEFTEFQNIVNEENCMITFAGEERSNIETLIQTLYKEITKQPPGWQLSAKSGFNMLLITIFRKMALPMLPATPCISNELLTVIKQSFFAILKTFSIPLL